MDKNDFALLLCTIEGFKSKFRELHWNAGLKSEHILCDDIMDSLTDFQDPFAESGFVFFGKLPTGTFIPETNYSQTIKEALKELLEVLYENKRLLVDDIKYCGLSAFVDDYINKVTRFITISQYK